MSDQQDTIPIGELIAGAFHRREAERALDRWRKEGHPSVIRRLEIASLPERATAEEIAHLAVCPHCHAAVEQFRNNAGGPTSDELTTLRPVRQPVIAHYQLAPVWGAAAKAGTDATSDDHANWQIVELSNGPMEVAVHRAEAGVPDVWIRLQKCGDPGLGRAFVVTLGNVHRLCVLVPNFNNLWTAEQKVEGETARRLSAAGEIELQEIDLADLVPEDLPVLLESLRFAWKPQKLHKVLDAWLAGNDNAPGAVVIRQALASPST